MWHLASDCLPDKNKEVLFYTQDGEFYKGYLTGNKYFKSDGVEIYFRYVWAWKYY